MYALAGWPANGQLPRPTTLLFMPLISVNGRELHYTEQGDGPLAVLIHGYPLDHTLWLDQLAALSEIRRVVAVDLPGYGMSERVTGAPLTMEFLAEEVAGLIESLEYEQADVVGLSMGGYVALALWEMYPRAIRSLVLANVAAAYACWHGPDGLTQIAERVHEHTLVLQATLEAAGYPSTASAPPPDPGHRGR